LAEALAKEPVEERERFFAAMLRPLGIEKAKPFSTRRSAEENPDGSGKRRRSVPKALTFDKRSKGIRYRPVRNGNYVLAPDITTNEKRFGLNPYTGSNGFAENKSGKAVLRLRSSPNKSAASTFRAASAASSGLTGWEKRRRI